MSKDDENSHHEDEGGEAGGHVVTTVAEHSEYPQYSHRFQVIQERILENDGVKIYSWIMYIKLRKIVQCV